LRRAEAAIGRSRPGDGPGWVGYFTPAHFAGTALRCFRDLGLSRQALRHADAALDLDGGAARTRALHTALIATAHAAAGDMDAAAELGLRALDMAGAVRSRRVRERFDDLAHRLTGHRKTGAVDQFLDRVSAQPAAA